MQKFILKSGETMINADRLKQIFHSWFYFYFHINVNTHTHNKQDSS